MFIGHLLNFGRGETAAVAPAEIIRQHVVALSFLLSFMTCESTLGTLGLKEVFSVGWATWQPLWRIIFNNIILFYFKSASYHVKVRQFHFLFEFRKHYDEVRIINIFSLLCASIFEAVKTFKSASFLLKISESICLLFLLNWNFVFVSSSVFTLEYLVAGTLLIVMHRMSFKEIIRLRGKQSNTKPRRCNFFS